jgi:asparagine synthase (glutamine-hydrolysing)
VVLTGDGADELGAGYARHFRERVFSAVQHSTLFPMIRGLSRVASRLPISRRAQKAFRLLQQTPQERIAEYHRVFSQKERSALFGPEIKLQTPLIEYTDVGKFPSTLDWLLWEELCSWLPDDYLMKVDKMSMAASLEARTPFLDHVLVERLMQVPASFKVNWRENKIPFRQLARRYLPPEIVDRPKHGFEIPLDLWMRTELKSFAADLLLSPPSSVPAPDPQLVRRYWDEHQQGKANHGLKLWTLLCWRIWCERYQPRC